jgi:hypothetical protein
MRLAWGLVWVARSERSDGRVTLLWACHPAPALSAVSVRWLPDACQRAVGADEHAIFAQGRRAASPLAKFHLSEILKTALGGQYSNSSIVRDADQFITYDYG